MYFVTTNNNKYNKKQKEKSKPKMWLRVDCLVYLQFSFLSFNVGCFFLFNLPRRAKKSVSVCRKNWEKVMCLVILFSSIKFFSICCVRAKTRTHFT